MARLESASTRIRTEFCPRYQDCRDGRDSFAFSGAASDAAGHALRETRCCCLPDERTTGSLPKAPGAGCGRTGSVYGVAEYERCGGAPLVPDFESSSSFDF